MRKRKPMKWVYAMLFVLIVYLIGNISVEFIIADYKLHGTPLPERGVSTIRSVPYTLAFVIGILKLLLD